MKKTLLVTLFISVGAGIFAQQNVGIGTNTPVNKLDVIGSIGTAFIALTGSNSPLALDETHSTILANPGTVINLPQASLATHRVYTIIYNGAAGGTAVAVNAYSGDHIGLAGVTYSTMLVTEGTLILQSDGTNWQGTAVSAAAGSNNYIQNQTTAAQTAGFEISGNGIVGGNVIVGTGEGSGAPNGTTLRAPNGSGSNITGGNLTIAAGNGTGSGGSGNIDFQTAPVAGAGTSANTLTTNMAISNNGNIGVGNATPNNSAILDLTNTNKNLGFLPPSMSYGSEQAITSPANGLEVYNTTSNCLDIFSNGHWQAIYCGCPALATLSGIQVSGNPVCLGSTNIYTVPGIAGVTSYQWSVNPNPGSISGLGGNSISFAAPATTFTVTVIGINACYTGTLPPPAPVAGTTTPNIATTGSLNAYSTPVAPPSWSGTAPSTDVCVNSSETYAISNGLGSNGTTAVSYTWSITATGSASITLNGYNVNAAASATFTTSTAPFSYPATYGTGAGTVTISVVANNTCASSSALLVNVTVHALPSVSITLASPNPVCQFQSISLGATPSGDGTSYSYVWSGNGLAGGQTTASATATPTVVGSQTYGVTVSDNWGCTSTANGSTRVTVSPLPTFSPAAPSICMGATNVGLTVATDIGGSFASGTGTAIGASIALNGSDPNYYMNAGSTAGTENFIYTAGDGCTSALAIIVKPLPAFNPSAPSICTNSTNQTLTVVTAMGGSFAAGTGTATGTTITGHGGDPNYYMNGGSVAGTENFVYTASNSCQAALAVIVNAQPTFNPSAPSICASVTGQTLTVTTATGGSFVTGTGSATGTTITGDGGDPNYYMNAGSTAGTESFVYTASNNCTATLAIIVTSPPVFTAAPASVTLSTSAQTVTYTVTIGASSYTWGATPTGWGISSGGGNTNSITYSIPGTYQNTATAMNYGGNQTISCTVVTSACGSTALSTTTVVHGTAEFTTVTTSAATVTIPNGISSLSVTVAGATGGTYAYSAVYATPSVSLGSYAGEVAATVPVTASQSYNIYVGGAGASATSSGGGAGGTNGTSSSGGSGATGTSSIYYNGNSYSDALYASGGGAASEFQTSAGTRILVAGGGGGSGLDFYHDAGTGGGTGVNTTGSGTGVFAGQNGYQYATGDGAGIGGGTTTGGTAVSYNPATGTNCTGLTGSSAVGTSAAGSNGAIGTYYRSSSSCYKDEVGGGGGGGYYGGSGGVGGGGGGGSSYANAGLITANATFSNTTTAGANGFVYITF